MASSTAYNADTRRMADDDIILTGSADGSGSAAISKMLHRDQVVIRFLRKP
jgi:hypothetical protein